MAIEVGNVLEGRVTGVKPFGAFVALPEGKSGMVHISEVSNEYVQDINTVLHDGDAVKVPREGGRGPARDAAPRVWQPKAPAKSDNLSFEDMMSRFKSQSEEKMADLDHETNNRRGGGYAPRSRRGR